MADTAWLDKFPVVPDEEVRVANRRWALAQAAKSGLQAAESLGVRNLYAAGQGIMGDLSSMTRRVLPGEQFGPTADEIQAITRGVRDAASQRDVELTDYPIVARGFRGVSESLPTMAVTGGAGGPYAALGAAGLMESNRALSEAREAGLSEPEAVKYAVGQGAIEAGVGAIFQKIGLGGIENAFSKQLARQTARQGVAQALKQAGIATLQELPEELLTEVGHNVATALSGVDPQATSGDQIRQTIADTTFQTLLTAGVVETPQIGSAVARGQQRAQRLSQLKQIRAKGYVSAEDGQSAGIQGATRKERLASTDAEIKTLEQEIQDAGTIPGNEAEVRQGEGRQDVRGDGQEQVRPEPAGEVPQAPEVQVEPPVKPGMVRVYHSGGELDASKRWVSTSRDYASNYRPDLPLHYLDIPESDPRVNNPDYPEQGVKQGFTFNFELPEREAAGLTQIARPDRAVVQRDVSAEIRNALPDGPVTVTTPEVQRPIEIRKVRDDGKVVSTSGNVLTPDDTWTVTTAKGVELTTPVQAPQPGQLSPGEVEQIVQKGVPAAQRPAPQQLTPMEIGPEGDATSPTTPPEPLPAQKAPEQAPATETLQQAPERVTEAIKRKGRKGGPLSVSEKTSKTRMDLILDEVERSNNEMTVQLEGANPDVLNRAIKAAEDRGMWATTDGNSLLIKPRATEKTIETSPPAPKKRTGRKDQPLADVLEPAAVAKESVAPEVRSIDKARAAKSEKQSSAAVEKYGPAIAKGWTLDTIEQDDATTRKSLQKEFDRIKGTYPIGNPDHPEAIRFRELKAQLEGKITKPQHLLRSPDGKRIQRLTKTEFDALKAAEAKPPKTKLAEAAGDATKFGKYPSQGAGIVATVPLATPGTGRSAKHFFQRFFTSRGELPQEVYDSKVAKEGRVAKEMNELRNRATDFRRGIRSALGGRELSQADVENMNAVLRGDTEPTTVPGEVRAPIEAMRDHIDALSRSLISEGVAQGDLVGIIEQNMGVYTTRSYRVFDDPKWHDQVPAGVRNRAVAAIREMYPGKSDAEVAGILESLLFRGAADTPGKLLKGSKLGSKDLTSFMLRKEVPEWLRDLWGEYKDAGVNYARSVFKMSHLLANQRFLNEVREAGLGKWLRTAEDGPVVNEYGKVVAKLAADSSSVMEPLNGLYTTPEIKKAFERLDSAGDMPDWLRVMMTINYAVKYGKTVGSAMTHVRNTVSNAGFAVANGHWRLDKSGKAIWATATGTFQLPNPEFRKYYNHLAELGIVGEDVRAGELKDALQDASQADVDEFLYNRELRHANKLVKAGRAGVRFLNSLYHAEDAVWKIYAFENEKARYAEAHPEWSAEELERRSAEIVRNTYPTYSKIPEGVKSLRRFPLIGTFVSFPSEVVRTTFHTLKLGIEELRAPETRSIGAQRLAGTAVALGGLSILSRAMMAMFGIGDDEDDDLRWFVPPWQENSRFIYTAKSKDATYQFIDLGYSDPHAYLTDAVVAFMRGDDWIDSIGKSLTEVARPFASEEILAGALMDVRSNEDNKVYNPKDEVGEQAKDIAEHLWTKALEPGTITSLRRIQTAAAGTDPEKEVTTEVLAVTTGQRLQKIDVEKSLGFRVRDFGKALTEIQSIARKTATSRGTATGEMVATDVARMEKLRLAEFAEMQQIIGAARRLGVPEKHIRTLLRNELSDDVAKQLLTGDYSPYKMTPQTIEQMRQAKPGEFKERFDAWRGELKRMRERP